MERQNIVVRHPSAWQGDVSDFFTSMSPSKNVTLTITIHVYGPLRSDEDWTRVDKDPADEDFSALDTEYHTRVLDPLMRTWISTIKSTFPAPQRGCSDDDKLAKLIFDFDITPPTDIDRMARNRLAQAEPRTLTRLAALLRATFCAHATSLEGVISGSPCWCRLQEQEHCIAALPPGRSYPAKRESHMQATLDELRAHWLDESMKNFAGYELEERKRIGDPTVEDFKGHFDSEGRRCLRLAKEHWEDAHWGGSGVDEEE